MKSINYIFIEFINFPEFFITYFGLLKESLQLSVECTTWAMRLKQLEEKALVYMKQLKPNFVREVRAAAAAVLEDFVRMRE
jgi:hypothetical protein